MDIVLTSQASDLTNRLNKLNIQRDLMWRDPGRFIPVLRLSCAIRMLVVTDSSGSFGGADFGLEEFLSAFDTRPGPGAHFVVTTAHWAGDPTADIQNFRFSAYDLSKYDVIWMFAVASSGSIDPADVRAVAEFMDSGGGVFATGDHANLGVRMCGSIPRVRSMRKWHWPNPGPLGEPAAPSGSGTGRHDTTMDRGVGVVEFDDQSDDVPQGIRPKMYFTPPLFLGYRRYRYPHPVLCGPNGVIRVLPDHGHEGECYVPADLTATLTQDGYDCEEYPEVNGRRIRPEIIAWSDNQSGIIEKGAVNDKTFGAIGVLDGHPADRGRVAVDATWHHFFNINLRGEIGNPDPVQATGFYASTAGQAHLETIKTYFRNTGVWLARPETQACIRWRALWHIRWNHRIAMDLMYLDLPFEKIAPLELIRIGRIARDVMGKSAPQCQSLGWLIPLFPIKFREKLLWPIVPPGPLLPGIDPREIERREVDPLSLAIAEAALDALAGAAIYRIALEFREAESVDKAEDLRPEAAEKLLSEAAEVALRALGEVGAHMLDLNDDIKDTVRGLRR